MTVADSASCRQVDQILKKVGKSGPQNDAQSTAVIGRLTYSDEYRKKHLQRVWQWRRLYRQRTTLTRRGSNLPQPTVIQAVEEQVAQWYVATLNEQNMFLTTQNRFDIEQVESTQRFFTRKVKEADFDIRWVEALRETSATGLGCMKHGLERVKIDGKNTWKNFYLSLNNEDYWLPPTERHLENPNYVIHLVHMRLSKIEELWDEKIFNGAGDPSALDRIRSIRDRLGASDGKGVYKEIYGSDWEQIAGVLSLPSPHSRMDPVDPLIPTLEYYGDLPKGHGTKLERNRIATLAFGNIMLRNVQNPNPWKPFVFFKTINSEVGPYGIGTAEIMEPSVIAQTEVQNMALDLLSQREAPMYVAGNEVELNQSHFQYSPGRIINLGERASISEFEQLKPPDMPQEAFSFIEQFGRQARGAVGVNDLVSGESRPPRKNAWRDRTPFCFYGCSLCASDCGLQEHVDPHAQARPFDLVTPHRPGSDHDDAG